MSISAFYSVWHYLLCGILCVISGNLTAIASSLQGMNLTSHPGVLHHVKRVDMINESLDPTNESLHPTVVLEDGSKWSIAWNGYGLDQVLNWKGDTVIITYNSHLLYYFNLINIETGLGIGANLKSAPKKGFQIRDVDRQNNLVYLNDGSIWSVRDFCDQGIYRCSDMVSWHAGDRIIMVVNDIHLSDIYPNILFNSDARTTEVFANLIGWQ